MKIVTLAPLCMVALAACSEPVPQSHAVDYIISGNASAASITLSNSQGGTEQIRARLPYHVSMTMPDGQFVYISAQNEAGGPIIACSISIDHLEYRHSQSAGRYQIASCSGEVGDHRN